MCVCGFGGGGGGRGDRLSTVTLLNLHAYLKPDVLLTPVLHVWVDVTCRSILHPPGVAASESTAFRHRMPSITTAQMHNLQLRCKTSTATTNIRKTTDMGHRTAPAAAAELDSAADVVNIVAAAAVEALLWEAMVCVGTSEMVRRSGKGYHLVFHGTLVCCKTFKCQGEVQHEIASPGPNTR